MKRRSFVLLTGLGLSAVGMASVNLLNLDFIDDAPYAKPQFLSQLCDDDTIRLLGHSYLQMTPAERNPDWLVNELYGGPVNITTLRKQDILLMQTRLENSIRKDFADRETVILEGWILSLTEARQCALYFILNS
jgi:hypothetical protein